MRHRVRGVVPVEDDLAVLLGAHQIQPGDRRPGPGQRVGEERAVVAEEPLDRRTVEDAGVVRGPCRAVAHLEQHVDRGGQLIGGPRGRGERRVEEQAATARGPGPQFLDQEPDRHPVGLRLLVRLRHPTHQFGERRLVLDGHPQREPVMAHGQVRRPGVAVQQGDERRESYGVGGIRNIRQSARVPFEKRLRRVGPIGGQ